MRRCVLRSGSAGDLWLRDAVTVAKMDQHSWKILAGGAWVSELGPFFTSEFRQLMLVKHGAEHACLLFFQLRIGVERQQHMHLRSGQVLLPLGRCAFIRIAKKGGPGCCATDKRLAGKGS